MNKYKREFNFKINTSPYYYEPTELELLKNMLQVLKEKANRGGIFSIENNVNSLTEPLLKKLLSMAIDGCSKEDIYEQGTAQIRWILKACKQSNYLTQQEYEQELIRDKNKIIHDLQSIGIDELNSTNIAEISSLLLNLDKKITYNYPKSFNKKHYLENLNKELITILQGALSIQAGETWEYFLTTLETCSYDLDKSYSQDNEFDKLILNEDIILEDPKELINKLLFYARKARMDGIGSIYIQSSEDKNPRIQENLRALRRLKRALTIVAIEKYVSEQLNSVKSQNNVSPEFLYYFEKELITIHSAVEKISQGINPRTLEAYLMSIYPELYLESSF